MSSKPNLSYMIKSIKNSERRYVENEQNNDKGIIGTVSYMN